MSASAGQRKQDKPDPPRGKEPNKPPNQPSPTDASKNANTDKNANANASVSNKCQSDTSILEELRKLRNENQDGHNHTKLALGRVEHMVSDIKDKLAEHEERMEKLEERVGTAEDVAICHRRALRYLLHRDIDLSAKCDDLQNRLRRNNIRIFSDPRGQ